jgi:threonine synthase
MNEQQTASTSPSWVLTCVDCAAQHSPLQAIYRCPCGGTLDVIHDLDALRDAGLSTQTFDERLSSRRPEDRSGVWRFRELILPVPPADIVTRQEGHTNLYDAPASLAQYAGVARLQLKHEGENPTASFKDRGMTAGVTIAKRLGMTRVACASTGNTSASMASYAAIAGMQAIVFIPAGKISYGKLSQALAYGALTLQVEGDFDAAMALVQQVCAREGIYLLNSVNPYRIEGQKAIAFELLQDLGWRVPDWVVVPGGNLGNCSALAKGLLELRALGLIDRLPQLAVVQAQGANPLYLAWSQGLDRVTPRAASTLATAIQIGDPVSWRKALRGLRATQGVVTEADDQAIMDAKAQVDAAGIGAEPASCATVAGIRRLVAEGVISPDAHVCAILTGHVLKDSDAIIHYHQRSLPHITSTFANAPIPAGATADDILRAIAAAPAR